MNDAWFIKNTLRELSQVQDLRQMSDISMHMSPSSVMPLNNMHLDSISRVCKTLHRYYDTTKTLNISTIMFLLQLAKVSI